LAQRAATVGALVADYEAAAQHLEDGELVQAIAAMEEAVEMINSDEPDPRRPT
jgi:hypothetical protein